MKHSLRFCIKILVAVFAFLIVISTTGVVEAEPIDYSALFSRVDTADGIFADMLASELADAFEADPKGFLDALIDEPESRQEGASFLLVYDLHYDDNMELESDICELRDTNPEYSKILDKIITDLEDFRANTEVSNAGTAPIFGQTPFDPETIRGFIDGNLELRNTDEGFYQTIANAYMMSPALFARTVADLSEKDIAYLGKAISYSLSRSKRTPLLATLDKLDPGYVANILLQRELRAGSVTLSDLKEINKEARKTYLSRSAKAVCERSLLPPIIGTMTYTSGQLVAGDYENLKITLSETTATMSSRSYWIEVYRTDGSTRQLLSERTVIIPPGNSSLDFNFSIERSITGSFFTYVKVYSEENGVFLVSKTET